MKILILKHIKTGKCRKINMREIIKYEGLEIRLDDHINGDEIVIKIFDKEVKKMKYFETQVVKVKKGKKEKYVNPLSPMCTNKDVCKRCIINQHCLKQKKMYKPKGNWVNRENLDKIKFPCFCRYNKKYFGLIYIDKENTYGLININKQREKWWTEDNGWYNLKNMINSYDIHILKGKIIIYNDDMEDKYSDE